MKNNLDYDTFIEKADQLIEKIITIIETYDEKGVVNIDIFDDKIVLNIEINHETISYIISKHGSYKEIWVVSPLSGPYRFMYNIKGEWINSSGIYLTKILTEEFTNFSDEIKFIV